MAHADEKQEDQAYWDGYTRLQHTKHALIRYYLNGWFPILGSWAGRVLYIDTHAGRGRHGSGHIGSPLVALETLLGHRQRERLLSRCEFRFVFFEQSKEHLNDLTSELEAYKPYPDGIQVDTYSEDSQEVLKDALKYLRGSGQKLAPAFAFVDPYGFKLSYPLLSEFMRFATAEILVNVMWRYLDMAIAQARYVEGKARLLDFVFDTPSWRTEIVSDSFEERAGQALALIQQVVGAKWATPVWMQGANNVTEYVLLHLTNHDSGRELMKRAMWAVCPSSDGTFVARKRDDPRQGVLLTVDPDLRPLKEWVIGVARRRPVRWKALHAMVLTKSWLEKHVNEVVRQLLDEGKVVPTQYSGRPSAASNPLLQARDEVTCP